MPLAVRGSARAFLSLGLRCVEALVPPCCCVFQATSHLLRTARRTLAFAELCILPPSFQRLQTQAPLSSSRALCPWLSISLSLKPHPVLEHTSRTCPPAQNDSPLFPAQVRRCDGTELPICVSVASDLLFKEENLRLLPGQPKEAVTPTHRRLWVFPTGAQTNASVFPGAQLPAP